METLQIVLLIGVIAAAVLIVVLLTSYITYRISFYSDRKRGNDAYIKKVMESYGEYGEFFKTLLLNIENSECERVFINSNDNLRLSARYFHKEDGAPLHILFHGYRSRAEFDMSGAAYECMSRSHNVLLVDQRAHGESDGATISFGINERQDLLLWCNYAKERFGCDVKIFIWGISMGGATVLMSLDLPLPRNVVGAIADCPFSSPESIIWRVGKNMHLPMPLLFPFLRLGARIFGKFRLGESSAEKAVVNAKIPVLLVHGEADNFVPCEMSEKIAETAKKSGVDLRFLKFKDAHHAMSYLGNTEEYRHAAFAFINEILERNK